VEFKKKYLKRFPSICAWKLKKILFEKNKLIKVREKRVKREKILSILKNNTKIRVN